MVGLPGSLSSRRPQDCAWPANGWWKLNANQYRPPPVALTASTRQAAMDRELSISSAP